MKSLTGLYQRALVAMASLTGKRFNLLVASSLVATTGIIAAAMTSSSDSGPLAALLGRSLAANTTPVAAPAPAPEPESDFGAGPSPSPAPAASSSAPLSSPAPAPAPEPAPEEEEAEPTPTTPEAPAVEAGPIKHVFVVSVASSGYEASFGATPQMPYLATTLRPQGVLLSNYSLLDTASLPNSIAAVSGQPPNPQTEADCPTYTEFPSGSKANGKGVVAGSGCIYPVETLSFADQIVGARLRWHAYMEGMVDETGKPDTCVQPEPEAAEVPVVGGYSARLNPFIYFHSLLDLGDCSENDVPFTELEKDLRKVETTPNYSYISPNLCNAGISGQCPAGAPDGAAAADAFLATVVPKILASPAYKEDGLLVIAFNQANPGPIDPATGLPAPPAADPLKVGALLVSRFGAPGATDAVAYNPYSLLASSEDLFGLSRLGNAGAAKVKSFAPALVGANGGD
ncbi:MAG TPA: alkaline phosphatase family protein [Solirubrobacterales bacterium]|nr:alkaline phosphatase family protein [Solirubrobacterales bacterium]